MSTDNDVARSLGSWLKENRHEDADRVLDVVFDQLPATPQRRAGWLARRFPIMNSNALRFVAAAAAVIVLAIIGIRFLPGVGSVGGPPSPTPIPTPVPLLNSQAPLPAGRYQVDPTLPMKVTVQVPDGWSAGAPWVVIGPKGNAEPDGMAVRFYVAPNLMLHPLSPSDGVLSPPPGPSVDDLVNAMVNHPDWTTTGPEAISIGGYAGKVVHVTLPVGTSDATPFYLFGDAAEGGQEWGWAAGQAFDIYVVDVGGERLVIDAFHYPGTSAEDLAAQTSVINLIQLTP
jgi:hypothetical protein